MTPKRDAEGHYSKMPAGCPAAKCRPVSIESSAKKANPRSKNFKEEEFCTDNIQQTLQTEYGPEVRLFETGRLWYY